MCFPMAEGFSMILRCFHIKYRIKDSFMSCVFPRFVLKWIKDSLRICNLYSIKEENIMAYVISDECVACGTCAGECPADAISEGDGKYVIDPDACLECGTCEAACPTGAISAE